MSNFFNFEIIQGSSLPLRVVAKNPDGSYINLSGFSARGYLKHKYSDTGRLLDLNPVIHGSYVSGIIDLNLAAGDTMQLPVTQAVYDIEVYNSANFVMKVIRGLVDINPEVTW